MKPSLFFILVLVGLTVLLTACPATPAPDKNFQLTVKGAGDGEGVVKSDPAGIDCGDKCSATFKENSTVTLTATAGEGSSFARFEGCTVDANNASVCTVEMDAAKEVTATFDKEGTTGDTFELEVTIAGNGVGTVESDVGDIDCSTGDTDCGATFDTATTVTLTAAPTDANSEFKGFVGCTVDANDANKCTVEVNDATAAKQVTATFEPAGTEQFTLTVTPAGAGDGTITSAPAGIDCGDTCAADFSEGVDVTLTATPTDTNSEFDSFSDNCTVADPTGAPNVCTVTMDAAKEVTVTFKQPTDPTKVTLTVEKKGNGSDQGFVFVETSETGSQEYKGPVQFDPDTEVTLNIVIGQGATTFLGWSGACVGTPSNESCELTLTADTNVVAQFSDGSEPTANGTIASLSDDAEEFLGTNPNNSAVVNGNVDVESGDLDLTFDAGPAQVSILSGMRFTGIALPADATILYSYIQFRSEAVSPADGSDTEDPNDDLPPVRIVISGEKSTSSGTFFEQFRNLSGRPDTDATVEWSPPAWNQGTNPVEPKRTPDITSIVQEIASQPGWDGADGSDGTMTFFIAPPKDENGDYIGNQQNYRQADAIDENGAGTPAQLFIIYETP